MRGDRNTSWLVIQRGLALIRRLMRGPATKDELLQAVRAAIGPDAYSESSGAADRALKNDRALLRGKLGIEIAYDRGQGVYWLADLGDAAWLDLPDDDLAAIGFIYKTFAAAGPEAARVRNFLTRIGALLSPERRAAVQRLRPAISIDLRELDERPISARVMQVVQQAVHERRRLGFNYRAASQEDRLPRYHEVEPYDILFRHGHWYLEGYDLFSRGAQHGEVLQQKHRGFRLQGILDDEWLAVLPERLPPGRRPQKRHVVRYRLTASAIAHGVSRHFADMRVEHLPDGSALVEGTTADPWTAARELLHYGENCVVLGGDEVLGHMRRMVAAMAKGYDLLAFETP